MIDLLRLEESNIRPGTESEYPSRIVLSKGPNEFCTHMEILPPDRPAYLISGHYDGMTLPEAVEDFQIREKRGF